MTFAAPASAFSASPSFRAESPGLSRSPRYSSNNSSELRFSAELSSQSTDRARRPFLAAQKPLARTAIPCGISTTSTTPATSLAAVASNLATVAPKTGGLSMTAVSIPGKEKSKVNRASPRVLAGTSTRGSVWWPIRVNSDGSLRTTSAGGSRVAALSTSSPNVAERPLAL